MANNLKLERISIEFAQRLNDGFTSAGATITGSTDGVILTALQRMNYINKAMLKLFNDVWISVKANKQAFAAIFPELVVVRDSITLSSNADYTMGSPNKDYFQLIEATVAGIQAAVLPASQYLSVKTGRVVQLSGSATNPVCIETGRIFYFFPAASFSTAAVVLTFIKFPLQPETTGSKIAGSFLTMSDATSEDSPFYDQWNGKIAEIAEQLFRQDAKE